MIHEDPAAADNSPRPGSADHPGALDLQLKFADEFHWGLLQAFVALCAILTLSLPVPAWAQEESVGSLGDLETQETESMGEATYKELAKVQEATEAEDFAEALRVLQRLGKKKLNDYERAQVLNLTAYVYYSQDQIPRAITAYEELLKQPGLPEALQTSTAFALAQLHFSEENWGSAIEMINRWMNQTEEPSKIAYQMLAQSYYQVERYREALEPAERVIEMTKQAGKPVEEHAYLLLRVLYYELEDYDRVAEILHELIELSPRRQYWMQLAGIYAEMGDQERQLNTMEIAYMQGYLRTETDLMSFVGLLLNSDLYYRGGKILQKAMDEGTISATFDNWRLLAQAWTMAQEYEKAIPALTRSAELSLDGEVRLILAQTFMNLGRWEEAVSAVRAALKKGGLDRPDQARVMEGQALYELERFGEARQAFEAAQRDSRSRQLAAKWITYIESEVERRARLAAALE